MRRTSHLIITLVALSMGCSDSPTGPTPTELATARQTWATKGNPSYAFTIQMACFCGVNGPVRAIVANDSVVSATLIATGESINPHWVPSIKSLFDFIDHGITNHAVVLRVTYDATLGYPREIVYDGATNIADDEVTYTVSNVALGGALNARN